LPDLKTIRPRSNTVSVGNAASAAAPSRFRDRTQISQSAINVAVRDAERQRLAREIHDDLGAELTALRYALARIADALPAQLATACNAAMTDAQAALDAAFQASRRLVDERHGSPRMSDPCKQLHEWVNSFAQRIDLPIAFDLKADPRLDAVDMDTGLALLRITQEALNNMAKHANAQNASVRLTILVSGIQLVIRDDGRGLGVKRASITANTTANNSGGASHGTGSGLHSMRERCEALGGRFELVSRAGAGVEVRAWVPWRGRVPAERRGSLPSASAAVTVIPAVIPAVISTATPTATPKVLSSSAEMYEQPASPDQTNDRMNK